MRFIGKWLIWIGGGAWLYRDLRPLVEECLEAWRRHTGIGPYTLEEWLTKFAEPVFILGVICAAALPDLNRRREKKKAKANLAAPTPVPPSPAP